jgi:RNA polymerase sigma factor (sigma-70 family)
MHLANESVMPVNALTSQSFQSELQTSIVAAVTMCFSSVVRNAQIVSEDQCELIRRAALKFAYKAGLRGDDAVDCEFAFVLQTLAEMNEDPDLGKILFSTPARLYARARNFASNIAKHLRMQAAIETPFETPTEPEPKMRCLAEIDASELPETHAIKAERNERLHKALACLLPAHRMLVVGHVLGGESFVVIAAAVGKSTAAVRQEFHRVMLRLQRMLEDPEEDPN